MSLSNPEIHTQCMDLDLDLEFVPVAPKPFQPIYATAVSMNHANPAVGYSFRDLASSASSFMAQPVEQLPSLQIIMCHLCLECS